VKRYGDLFDRIIDPDNIKLAYYKACKGKRDTQAVKQFDVSLQSNLADLRSKLLHPQFVWGPYRYFKIYDPKERVISAASFDERILQHAIMNILDPCFERHYIHHSYACRKGKGTHRAVIRAFEWTRSRGWFLKLDIRKYFDSIDHKIVNTALQTLIKDQRVLALLDGLLASYQTVPGYGVPIGNLTSQYFANLYLSTLDHFILEELGFGAYVRYMDDFVLWGDNKPVLVEAAAAIKGYLESKLGLRLKVALVGKCKQGLPFLGFLIKSEGIFLLQKTKSRMISRANEIEQLLTYERITEYQAACRATSVNASVTIARSQAFRAKLWHGSSLGL